MNCSTTSAASFLSTPSARRATAKNVIITKTARKFLSTPSARRATFNEVHKTNLRYISIHALREEGDVEGNTPKE